MRFPFVRVDLSYSFRDGYAERRVAVEHGDTNLGLRGLMLKVAC